MAKKRKRTLDEPAVEVGKPEVLEHAQPEFLRIERLQIQLDAKVIAETKIRAIQGRTTTSAIVTEALLAYLKL